VSPHVLRQTCLRPLAATTGVHDARETSGHQSDRDLWRDVVPDLQTLVDALHALAGEASPLLQHKAFIALGHHLHPFGPHHRSAVRTGKQEPGFPGDVRPHEPRVGLGLQNLRARLRDVRNPGCFRLGRRRNPRILLVADITDAVADLVHERRGQSCRPRRH
jgi:hypothetical protein